MPLFTQHLKYCEFKKLPKTCLQHFDCMIFQGGTMISFSCQKQLWSWHRHALEGAQCDRQVVERKDCRGQHMEEKRRASQELAKVNGGFRSRKAIICTPVLQNKYIFYMLFTVFFVLSLHRDIQKTSHVGILQKGRSKIKIYKLSKFI